MRTGIIYGYTNLESGRMYIGQTVHPNYRWKQHRYCKNATGWHKDYQNNPDKYEYSVIEYDVPEDKLDEREIFWIRFFDSYHNGYNLTPGGNLSSGFKDKHHSDEAKKKIGEASKKLWKDPEYLKKMKNRPKQCGEKNGMYGDHRFAGENHPMYGKHHTEEAKQKISARMKSENNPMYGKTHSLETRKKISEHHADVSGENNPNFGKHFYTDGNKNIVAYECPEGFRPGKTIFKNKKCT